MPEEVELGVRVPRDALAVRVLEVPTRPSPSRRGEELEEGEVPLVRRDDLHVRGPWADAAVGFLDPVVVRVADPVEHEDDLTDFRGRFDACGVGMCGLTFRVKDPIADEAVAGLPPAGVPVEVDADNGRMVRAGDLELVPARELINVGAVEEVDQESCWPRNCTTTGGRSRLRKWRSHRIRMSVMKSDPVR